MTAKTISVSYNTAKHPAMVRLSREPSAHRSEIVRDAVAQYYERHNGTTLDDVLRAIERLEQRGVAIATGELGDNGDEPSAAALALEELGL